MLSTRAFLLVLLLAVATGAAKGAHITDKLVVGLYAKAAMEGSPFQLLSSGTPLEVLRREGDFVEVQMADDVRGWVEARYVTEDKPAKVMLLEAQTKLRQLNGELKTLKENGASGGDQPAAPPSPLPPTAREAQLRQTLADADSRICELERRLAQRPVAEAAERQLRTLRQEVQKAVEVLADAQGVELHPVGGETGQTVLIRYRIWIVGLIAILLGFGGGVAFIDYRIRKRYGGFRI